jgi:AcrR family transcriptional regulator
MVPLMARRYEMRSRGDALERTRQAIVDAAWRRFSVEPFDRVSIASIAADAGVSARTVLNQFVAKEALFVAAYERVMAEAEQARPGLAPGDALGAARQVCVAYEDRGDALMLLLSQERSIAAVGAMLERSRRAHRLRVAELSAPLLSSLDAAAAERRLAQLIAVTDLQFWHLLRRGLGLSAEQTVVATAEALGALAGLGVA